MHRLRKPPEFGKRRCGVLAVHSLDWVATTTATAAAAATPLAHRLLLPSMLMVISGLIEVVLNVTATPLQPRLVLGMSQRIQKLLLAMLLAMHLVLRPRSAHRAAGTDMARESLGILRTRRATKRANYTPLVPIQAQYQLTTEQTRIKHDANSSQPCQATRARKY